MKSYICVLSTDDYLDGVLFLDYNLKVLSSKYPLLCLINESISERTRKILDYFNIKYKEVNAVKYTSCKNYDRWNYSFDKLNVFSLTEYEKIVSLDLDFLLLKNIDHLFDFNRVAMNGDIPYSHDKYNSSLMVIEPNMNDYNNLLEITNKYEEEKKDNIGDQNIINEYYKDKYVYKLNTCFNQMRMLRKGKVKVFDQDTNSYIEVNKCVIVTPKVDDPFIIHYISQPKPFMVDGIYNDEYSKLYKSYLDKIKEKLKEFDKKKKELLNL